MARAIVYTEIGSPAVLHLMEIPDPVAGPGEVVVRTDKGVPCGLFMGYYRDEEKTKESWSDGLYHTGDTA